MLYIPNILPGTGERGGVGRNGSVSGVEQTVFKERTADRGHLGRGGGLGEEVVQPFPHVRGLSFSTLNLKYKK